MRLLVSALLLVGCGGGVKTPLPDADPNAPLCTGAVYDNCLANTGCASGNCHLFEADAIQVCTQACSASSPCPNDASGAPGSCNAKGICKPARANPCRPN
jgi:hypothetical protein